MCLNNKCVHWQRLKISVKMWQICFFSLISAFKAETEEIKNLKEKQTVVKKQELKDSSVWFYFLYFVDESFVVCLFVYLLKAAEDA